MPVRGAIDAVRSDGERRPIGRGHSVGGWQNREAVQKDLGGCKERPQVRIADSAERGADAAKNVELLFFVQKAVQRCSSIEM